MRRFQWILAGTLGAVVGLGLVGSPILGQQILQNGFEVRGPFWKAGSSDALFKVLAHGLTDETAHQGQRSEQIRIEVEKGSYIHYTFDVPRAPITEELNLSLWIKSNRPGVALLCRMVFPRERDPKNIQSALSVLVRCEPYQSTRWKMLTLRQPQKRLREQQQLLAHQQGRPIDTTGAYIDQLVLNLFDGPGKTDVFIDDLEIGPVLDGESASVAESKNPAPAGMGARPTSIRRSGEVQIKGSQLYVNGKPFLMRAIRHTGTPLATLRDAGFNTVCMDATAPRELIADAVAQGMYIIPSVVPPGSLANNGALVGQLTSNQGFKDSVFRFLSVAEDRILAWDLGSNLVAERFPGAARLAGVFRTVDPDPQRPVIGDIWDGYRGYSRGLDGFLIGTHRWPLMTSFELASYREWLISRRRLSSDAYCWTWIQTHSPEWFLQLTRPAKNGENFSEPVGPQPEQIRLLTYCALAAGYRGLAFWSDRFLADSHNGRDRLLAMALLNQELTLLEPMIVNSSVPEWIDTSRKEVKAAVFRGSEGILVLPIWVGIGSQFVPGQGAASDLIVTVPGIPVTASAWEVSPGRMQAYPILRDESGLNTGRQVRLKNFSLTAAILFTSDLAPNGLVVRLQDRQRRMGRLAAQYLHDQAQEELNKVEKVNAEIEQVGYPVAGAAGLLKQSRKALESCNELRRNGEHTEAFTQAEVALRALRVLMRAHWDRATRDLDSPVASPFAVSFFTLPRHFRLLDRIAQSRPAATVLPDGDFEIDPAKQQTGWIVQQVPTLDQVEIGVRRVKELSPYGKAKNAGLPDKVSPTSKILNAVTPPKPLAPVNKYIAHTGSQSLRIQITPKNLFNVPAALERTYVAVHSPAVKLPPGTLVRVSAWVYMPGAAGLSPDGAMFFDSAGGEPLAVRITLPLTKWKRFSLYREVPESGRINVTLAMSGIGTVYFDDVRIEPLEPSAASPRSTMKVGASALPVQPPTR